MKKEKKLPKEMIKLFIYCLVPQFLFQKYL